MQFFVNEFTLTAAPTTLAALYNTQHSLTGADAIDYLGFKGQMTVTGGSVALVDPAGRTITLAAGETHEISGCDLAKVQASGNTFKLRLIGVSAQGW